MNSSENLRSLFSDIKIVKKNEDEIPFSLEIILDDLISSGIPVLDAIDCVLNIKPNLRNKMDVRTISKIINKTLDDMDYGPSYHIKGTLNKQIRMKFKDSEQVLNFKTLKEFVNSELYIYDLTSKTFRAIVEELFRIIKSLRTKVIDEKILKNMLSSSCLNIVGVNPFDVNNRNEDYLQLVKLMRQFDNTWSILPVEEKYILVENIFNHIFKIILISFKYLPGHVFSSTLYQITNFSTRMGQLQHPVLSDKEIFQLGKMARKIDNMRKLYKRSNISQLKKSINRQNWVDELSTLDNVVQGLMNHGSVYWIILVDNMGNELISKFASNASTRNKNLLSMAMSGVQTLVSEITNTSINQIDQEKTSILIEKRGLFSLMMLVQKPVRHKFQQVLDEIARYVEINFEKEIMQFKGKLNVFKELEIYIEEKMKDLMI